MEPTSVHWALAMVSFRYAMPDEDSYTDEPVSDETGSFSQPWGRLVCVSDPEGQCRKGKLGSSRKRKYVRIATAPTKLQQLQ